LYVDVLLIDLFRFLAFLSIIFVFWSSDTRRWIKSIYTIRLILTQLVKQFPAFCGTRGFITVFTRTRHWSTS
jgi:hypothetical protein